MLPTLWLETWILPILMGSDQVMLVIFMTGSFPFKYGQFVSTTCWEVLFSFLTTTNQELLPDKMVTV